MRWVSRMSCLTRLAHLLDAQVPWAKELMKLNEGKGDLQSAIEARCGLLLLSRCGCCRSPGLSAGI